MTEDELKKELDSCVKQMQTWWKNKYPESTKPRKLFNKIQFLKAYLRAIEQLKNDQEVERVIRRIAHEYWGTGTFKSKL